MSIPYVATINRMGKSPDNNQHKNHEMSTQQEHVGELHAPLMYPTKGGQGKFEASPANMLKNS